MPRQPQMQSRNRRKLWLISLLLTTTFTSGCAAISPTTLKPHYSVDFLTKVDAEYDKDGPATKEVIKIWMAQNGL